MEAAEPEVRRAGQGEEVSRAWESRVRPQSLGSSPQVPKNVPRSATKITISTPGSRPVAGGQETPSEGQQGESFCLAMDRDQGPAGLGGLGLTSCLGRGKPVSWAVGQR